MNKKDNKTKCIPLQRLQKEEPDVGNCVKLFEQCFGDIVAVSLYFATTM